MSTDLVCVKPYRLVLLGELVMLERALHLSIMNMQTLFKDALDILQLKDVSIHSVAHDDSKMQNALLCLGLGAVASSLGFLLFPVHMGIITYRPDLVSVLLTAVGSGLTLLLSLSVLGFLAEKLFQSKLETLGFVRVLATASLVNVLSLIPSLGLVAGIWMLVVTVKVLTTEGKLQPLQIGILLFLTFIAFAALSFFGLGYGML